MSGSTSVLGSYGGGLEHEALVYRGEREFVESALPFIQEGLHADEPILVVVTADKIDLLRSVLGEDARRVRFADMAVVGRNPMRLIPVWQTFLRNHAGPSQRVRGIGEPVFAGRTRQEIVECVRHEALLNVAFDSVSWRLLCPYDADSLEPSVLEEAARTHPVVHEGDHARPSHAYAGVQTARTRLDDPLPDPGTTPHEVLVEDGLGRIRGLITERATAFGLEPGRVTDLTVAVNELAANSLRHGGGRGLLRLWEEGETLLVEVQDGGRSHDPLIGRHSPTVADTGGWGLWLVNQLCDLVQLRSGEVGTIVRLHMVRALPSHKAG